MKRIRPKCRRKIGSMEHSTDGISNSLMCTFNRAVLVGRISTSGANVVVKTFEESLDLGVLVEFTTLVHVDILVSAPGCMVLEEVTKPGDGGSFGETGITMETSRLVVSNKDPGGFTIKADIVCSLVGFGLGSREREVDGKTLISMSSSLG